MRPVSRPIAAPTAPRGSPHLPVCLLILLASLSWSLLCGQDVNWDLQNYHEYDPFALLHWRHARDVAPGGPQSFLNPLPYLLPYGLHRLLPPLAAGLLLAASQSACLMLAWFIAWTLCPRPVRAMAATVAAISGPTVLAELGTSFSDLVLAMPPLASILLVLRAPVLPQRRAVPILLLAGALTGSAIGIKPTSLFLLPALAAFAAMRQDRASRAARATGLAVAGAAAGAMLSDGAWALFLWRDYGSPVFPFMNTVFRSGSAALVDFGDPRYRFTGWRHALAIPFDLAAGSTETGELPIRDGRLALAASLALVRLPTLRWRPSRAVDPLTGLCAYLLIALAGWLVLCPIQRYAATLEMLSGLLCILLLPRLPGRAASSAATVAVTILLVATTRPGENFHRPWRDAYRPLVPAGIPPGATYGLLAQPLAYWVTTPPRPAHAFGLMSTLMETGGVLQRRLDDILRSGPDRLWLLNLDEPVDGQIRAEMSIHGMALAPPCLRAASMIWIDTVFCRGVLVGSRRLAASDLHPGEAVSFSAHGYGLIYEIGGFVTSDPDGTWAVGHDAILALHLDAATRRRGATLSLQMAGVGGAPPHSVAIIAEPGQRRTVTLAPPAYTGTALVCIAAAADGDGVVLIRFGTAEIRSLAELGLSAEPRQLAFKLYAMRLGPPGPCLPKDAAP